LVCFCGGGRLSKIFDFLRRNFFEDFPILYDLSPTFISQNTKTNNQQGNPLYPLPPSDSTPQHDPPSVENGVAAAFQKCDHRLPMFPFASVLIFFFLFFPIDVHPL
jgi:hypothetical protein